MLIESEENVIIHRDSRTTVIKYKQV